MDKALFVQNIKYFCGRNGVKPTVACRESGVGQSFINNIEARGQTPSVEKAQMLAKYLGVTVSDLLGETKPEDLTLRDSGAQLYATDLLRLTVAEVEMILAYRRATERDRALVDLTLGEYKKGAASDAG